MIESSPPGSWVGITECLEIAELVVHGQLIAARRRWDLDQGNLQISHDLD